MTIEELAKIGIPHQGRDKEDRMFWIPRIGRIKIPKELNIEGIYNAIYIAGKTEGIKFGKESKAREIRNSLGI